MKTLFSTLLFLAFSIITAPAHAQVNDQLIRQHVLTKGIIDSNFIFGKWSENEGAETHLKYLGKVTNKHGHTFKVLNSVWYWGPSRRATSRIIIFTDNNRYVGNYYVTVASGLPTKMQNGNLIFKNRGEDCDSHLTSSINLKNGFPKHFFIKCQNEYGEMYSFSNK